MPFPNDQPILPAEGTFTEIEDLFRSEEPPGLFPVNQDSNFGTLRRVITDPLQDATDAVAMLYNNLFVATSDELLASWENQFGLPDMTGILSVADRRIRIQSRRERGPFTKTRVKNLIERYIQATFGAPIEFTAAGIPFDSGGIPFHAAAADVSTLYRVYWNPRNYSFEIYIVNTVTPDLQSLNREITRISPYSYTLDNTHAEILDYFKTVRNDQPEAYYRLGSLSDASGYGLSLTANGGVTAGGGTTIVNTNVAGGDAATTFDGVNDYFNRASAQQFMSNDNFSIEAWINPTAALQIGTIAAKDQWQFRMNASGKLQLLKSGTIMAESTTALAAGTSYYVLARKKGTALNLRINAANETLVTNAPLTLTDSTGDFTIGAKSGGSEFFKGRIDDVAFYQRWISDAEALMHYRTGIDTL
jgi:hypothetical protein